MMKVIKQKNLIRTAKKAFFENALNENRDNSFFWKHVKDITGQSQANKLPSALQSDQGLYLLCTYIVIGIKRVSYYSATISDYGSLLVLNLNK